MKKTIRLKRILCLALCAMMVLGLSTPTFATEKYSDEFTPNSFLEAAIRAKKEVVLDEYDAKSSVFDETSCYWDFPPVYCTKEGGFSVTVEAEEATITCVKMKVTNDWESKFFDEPVSYAKIDTYPDFDQQLFACAPERITIKVYATDCNTKPRVTIKRAKIPGKKYKKYKAKFAVKPWSNSADKRAWKKQHGKENWESWLEHIGVKSYEEWIKCYGVDNTTQLQDRLWLSVYDCSTWDEFTKKFKKYEDENGILPSYNPVNDSQWYPRKWEDLVEFVYEAFPDLG